MQKGAELRQLANLSAAKAPLFPGEFWSFETANIN